MAYSEMYCSSIAVRLKCGVFIAVGFLSTAVVNTLSNLKGFLVPFCNSPALFHIPINHTEPLIWICRISVACKIFYICGIKG